MKTLSDYLDMAATITGSDYQTAKRLNITRSSVSKCRSEGTMKTGNVVALAELIGVNPAEIVAACDIAKNPENARIWAKWGAVAGVIMAVITDQLFFNNQSVATGNSIALFIYYANYCVAALIIALVWYLWSIHSSSQKEYRSC
ncbi:hypothetical protein ULF88_24120 [Halopseudomonas pachastrellae]|nr:hypothetical protein [Halopseudomonas pachastrellae]MEB3736243.1 hypothetical protein [Halopseudomonas pachastrellae]|tara:strand:- start:350 stop:781 length:432 start_codon:yes stop_codon:yes gene_type:complete